MIYFIMQYSLLVWHAGMALMLGKEEGHLCDADISMLYIYGIPMSGTISLTNNNGNYLSLSESKHSINATNSKPIMILRMSVCLI